MGQSILTSGDTTQCSGKEGLPGRGNGDWVIRKKV